MGGRCCSGSATPADGFTRLAVLEAPIDALSLAAIERVRATPSTWRPAAAWGLARSRPGAASRAHAARGVLVSAADANAAGDRYAARHAELAAAAGVAFEGLRPPEGGDWNDVLVNGRGA